MTEQDTYNEINQLVTARLKEKRLAIERLAPLGEQPPEIKIFRYKFPNVADPIDQLVSQRLKEKRLALSLSLKDIADTLELSIKQIQKYEQGTTRISSGKLYFIAKFLKLPITDFFDEEKK